MANVRAVVVTTCQTQSIGYATDDMIAQLTRNREKGVGGLR